MMAQNSNKYATKRETVGLLCKSILNRLENQKMIVFPPRLRQVIQDEIQGLIGPYILTDEDLNERTRAKLGAKVEELANTEFTESDQYKTAKSMVKATFGDDQLNGFYFQRPLKNLGDSIVQYLMRSSNIEDVFEPDEVLQKNIIEIVQKFDPNNLH